MQLVLTVFAYKFCFVHIAMHNYSYEVILFTMLRRYGISVYAVSHAIFIIEEF